MGEASVMGVLLEDGRVSRMLYAYKRSLVKESSYPSEGKLFDFFSTFTFYSFHT